MFGPLAVAPLGLWSLATRFPLAGPLGVAGRDGLGAAGGKGFTVNMLTGPQYTPGRASRADGGLSQAGALTGSAGPRGPRVAVTAARTGDLWKGHSDTPWTRFSPSSYKEARAPRPMSGVPSRAGRVPPVTPEEDQTEPWAGETR